MTAPHTNSGGISSSSTPETHTPRAQADPSALRSPQSPNPNKVQPKFDPSLRILNGQEKAAALLLALGPSNGKRIWEELSEQEIRQLSRTMVRLGPIAQEVLDDLLTEFVMGLAASGSMSGNAETTERLLYSFLPKERVDQIMEDIRGPAGHNIWEKLSNVQEDTLANYLRNEYPQTIAVVLTRIAPPHAARVLSIFPPQLALEVIQRMLMLDPVKKDILDKIEHTLRNEFMSNLAHTRRRDSHEQMADIFNAFDRQTESRFMSSLETLNRDGADRIKSLMFTFEDLLRLQASAIQSVIQRCDRADLTLALKGAPEHVQEIFFANMSSRTSAMVKEDIEVMGQVRLKDVEDAQGRLVTLAKDMGNRGEIYISKGNDEDEMVG